MQLHYCNNGIQFPRIHQWNVTDFYIIQRIEQQVCVSRSCFNPGIVEVKLAIAFLFFFLKLFVK
jgi:hypothetical protein